MWQANYDAWGNQTMVTGQADFIPFGFAGGLADPDTGLIRFGARDYDPRVGRWTAKDPLLFGGGSTNLYEYCGGDSVNCVDPTGKDFTTLPAQSAVEYLMGPRAEPDEIVRLIGEYSYPHNLNDLKKARVSDRDNYALIAAEHYYVTREMVRNWRLLPGKAGGVVTALAAQLWYDGAKSIEHAYWPFHLTQFAHSAGEHGWIPEVLDTSCPSPQQTYWGLKGVFDELGWF